MEKESMKREERAELHSILKELHNLSGFRISVHDTDFREIEAFPETKSSFCRLIQSAPDGRSQCVQSDLRAFAHVRGRQDVYLYQCRFGLYEAIAPLHVLGHLAGYLMMGQSIDGSPGSREAIVRGGAAVMPDRAALEAASREVCVCAKDKILSCIRILDICARYITLSSRFFLHRADLADSIKEYVDTRFARKITIPDICTDLLCSRTAAIRAFREKYGTGINEYLIAVRMRAARSLLGNTAVPIREIAERCGFADQNYFSRAFHKADGLTPSVFRRQCRAAAPGGQTTSSASRVGSAGSGADGRS